MAHSNRVRHCVRYDHSLCLPKAKQSQAKLNTLDRKKKKHVCKIAIFTCPLSFVIPRWETVSVKRWGTEANKLKHYHPTSNAHLNRLQQERRGCKSRCLPNSPPITVERISEGMLGLETNRKHTCASTRCHVQGPCLTSTNQTHLHQQPSPLGGTSLLCCPQHQAHRQAIWLDPSRLHPAEQLHFASEVKLRPRAEAGVPNKCESADLFGQR